MLRDVNEAVGALPPGETIFLAEKIALATGIGLLIGLERQWAHKEPGTRSFALTSVLGALVWLFSPTVAFIRGRRGDGAHWAGELDCLAAQSSPGGDHHPRPGPY